MTTTTKTNHEVWMDRNKKHAREITDAIIGHYKPKWIEVVYQGEIEGKFEPTPDGVTEALKLVDAIEWAAVYFHQTDDDYVWIDILYDYPNEVDELVRDFGAPQRMYEEFNSLMSRIDPI